MRKKLIELQVPPHDFDSELYVLGVSMLFSGMVNDCVGVIPEMFYDPKHKAIWTAILDLNKASEPIDLVTVAKYFRDRNLFDSTGVDPLYLTKIVNKCGAGSHLQHHVSIIKDAYVRREAWRSLVEAAEKTYDRTLSIASTFDSVNQRLSEYGDLVYGQSAMNFKEQVEKEVDRIEKAALSDIKVSGVETGNPKLDSITGGWQKTDLILLSGRPGSGKTTRAINFAMTAAKKGMVVALFSLEMSSRQFIKKMINDDSGVFIRKMSSGEMSQYDLDKIRKSADGISKLPIYLDDKAAIPPSYVKGMCWALKRKSGLDLVVIDYLQLMSSDIETNSREQEVGNISRALKAVAKELDVPVIALSQLSRKTEERTDKRPIISDLRESGSLEQDSDMVLGCYRPSYYYTLDKDRDYNTDPTIDTEIYRRISELHILKHRNGETDTFITEYFYGEFSRFTPEFIQPYNQQQPSITPNQPLPF